MLPEERRKRHLRPLAGQEAACFRAPPGHSLSLTPTYLDTVSSKSVAKGSHGISAPSLAILSVVWEKGPDYKSPAGKVDNPFRPSSFLDRQRRRGTAVSPNVAGASHYLKHTRTVEYHHADMKIRDGHRCETVVQGFVPALHFSASRSNEWVKHCDRSEV